MGEVIAVAAALVAAAWFLVVGCRGGKRHVNIVLVGQCPHNRSKRYWRYVCVRCGKATRRRPVHPDVRRWEREVADA